MNGNGRTTLVALVALAVAVTGLVLWLADGWADRPPTAGPLQEGYPPPQVTPTATPAADAAGYLPAPEWVTTTVVTLAESPYSELLGPLQTALDERDAGGVAVFADTGVALTSGGRIQGAQGAKDIDPDEIAGLLATYLASGGAPRLQGYYVETFDDGSVCLDILSHPFVGLVPHPTTDPQEPDVGPIAPEYLQGDAASWRLCRNTDGAWQWQEWTQGEYYPMVRDYADMRYRLAPVYFVIRPR